MYIHPKLAAFQNQLESLFHEVDEFLEDEWGSTFSLHPNRPRRGDTGNPEMDGLFNIAPDFTAGYGSQRGRGYIVSIKVATLDRVSPEQFELLMEQTAAFIQRKLPQYFPHRDLTVVRDGKRFKIIGDFSLGDA